MCSLQEKWSLMTVFHRQGKIYMSKLVIVHICYLCQCQEKYKTILTYIYVKMMKTSQCIIFQCFFHDCQGCVQHMLRLFLLVLSLTYAFVKAINIPFNLLYKLILIQITFMKSKTKYKYQIFYL